MLKHFRNLRYICTIDNELQALLSEKIFFFQFIKVLKAVPFQILSCLWLLPGECNTTLRNPSTLHLGKKEIVGCWLLPVFNAIKNLAGKTSDWCKEGQIGIAAHPKQQTLVWRRSSKTVTL